MCFVLYLSKNCGRVGYKISDLHLFQLKTDKKRYMRQCMRFPTMWYVRLAKPQTSLCIRAVWSESLLVAWVISDKLLTEHHFGVSKLKRRLQIWEARQSLHLSKCQIDGNLHLVIPRVAIRYLCRKVDTTKPSLVKMGNLMPGLICFRILCRISIVSEAEG